MGTGPTGVGSSASVKSSNNNYERNARSWPIMGTRPIIPRKDLIVILKEIQDVSQ